METIQAEIDMLHKKELEMARNYAQQHQDADEMQNDIAIYMSKKGPNYRKTERIFQIHHGNS
jgi:hypothetical protein